MDFISGLLMSKGYGNVIMTVDRVSKYVVFTPLPTKFLAKHVSRLFFKRVVKYLGILRAIISDLGARFIGKFWMEHFKIMGIDLHFSASFHP